MNSLKSEQTDAAPSVFAFGPFRLNAARRTLMRDAEPVTLSPRTFDLLVLLVRERNRVVGKSELMEALWPDVVVEENNLMQQVSTLRKALGERADEGRYIRTVPGHGYRFVGEIGERPPAAIEPRNRDWRPLLAFILVALALLAIVAFLTTRRPAPASQGMHSLAVLPFKSIGGRDDEYLGLGMTDVLITRLSNASGVIVRPTSAVRRFAAEERDAIAAGKELKVDTVLEGTIQHRGADVRVTVRLFDVATRRSLWGETYDERFTNLFAVEDAIASRLLADRGMKRLTHHDTQSPAAHELYLKGRYYSGLRTSGSFEKAVESYQQAIAADPTYALAYDGLADAYYRESTVHMTPAEAVPKARAAAMKALQFDNDLADAHATLGVIKFRYDWDFRGAEREFRTAIALNRNCVTAHQWYSEYLTARRRTNDAVAEAKMAEAIDPLSAEVGWNLGLALFFGHRDAEAIAALRESIALSPQFWLTHAFLAWAYGESARFDEAFGEYRTALALDDNADTLSHKAEICMKAGRTAEARQIVDELIARSKRGYVDAVYLAAASFAVGDRDRGFEYLDEAVRAHSELLVFLDAARSFDDVRSDPRFLAVMKKVGLRT